MAEFVLLHMLSRVHARVDDMPLGKLSLNIVGLPALAATEAPEVTGTAAAGFGVSRSSLAAKASPAGRVFASVYNALVPHCVALPLSRSLLCDVRLVPAKVCNGCWLGPWLWQPRGLRLRLPSVLAPLRLTDRGVCRITSPIG